MRLEWPGVGSTRWTPSPAEPAVEEAPHPAESGDADPERTNEVTGRDPFGIPSLPEDVSTDIAVLRSEVELLKQTIHDLSDRVQLRHLGTVLDELADLRAVVRELVELRPAAPKLGSLAPLVAEIAALREELSLEPVLAQLAELRSELTQMRRRMRLRADRTDSSGF
ncbi:MAG: hypothetical protein ACRDZU_17410 [Acidimicrobiales bacterium]